MAQKNMSLTKCPMPSLDPNYRNKVFEEVATGYTYEMAIAWLFLHKKEKIFEKLNLINDISNKVVNDSIKTFFKKTDKNLLEDKMLQDGVVRENKTFKENLKIINLAKKYNSEIINCDQSQMRKLLNIGTAKITNEEMDGVKHHLIDFLEPISEYSIKDFQDDARQLIDHMETIPFIVGGSGLYIDAVITDYDLTNQKRDNDLEQQFKDLSNEELYNKLYDLNQDAALKTHPNNRKRVLRYLEIVLEKGSIENKPNEPYYNALIIFLNKDRDILYDNINKRCEIMFNEGWIDEVKNLKELGYNIDLIKEIGYKEISDYLLGLNCNLVIASNLLLGEISAYLIASL